MFLAHEKGEQGKKKATLLETLLWKGGGSVPNDGGVLVVRARGERWGPGGPHLVPQPYYHDEYHYCYECGDAIKLTICTAVCDGQPAVSYLRTLPQYQRNIRSAAACPEAGDWLLRFVPHRQLANKSPKHAPKPVTASYGLYPAGSSPTTNPPTYSPTTTHHSTKASNSASVSCMSSAPLMQSISRLLLFWPFPPPRLL